MCGMCSMVDMGRDCHANKLNGVIFHRTRLGMTQKELAEKAGINIRQVQKYESGEYDIGNMTLKNALSISEALKCDVRDLLK